MQITSKWMDGMCFVATDEAGHSVVMEGSAAEGCVRRGPSPMEMLLMGVAGCSSTDVVMIVEKQRQDITGCQAAVTAKRAEEPPRVFTEIHIHFTVTGRGLNYVGQNGQNNPQLRNCRSITFQTAPQAV